MVGKIEGEMSAAGFWDDQERAKARVVELKDAKQVVESLKGVGSQIEDLEVLAELAAEEGEAGMAELEKTVSTLEKAYDVLELRTLLSGRYDRAGAVVTIQSGAGGTDASDWAEILLRMYNRWASDQGFKAELLEALEHDEAGIKHATLRVSGTFAYGYLSCEMGVHRLVRLSPFDAQNRRQTSFAAVDVTPDLDADLEVDVADKDVKVDTYKAGGKGGQHVNKTESAVRLTHLPTGVVVQCQNERSQHKNKAQAMKLLKAKLLQVKEAARSAELKSMYDGKGEIAWGNQIRSYVMQPYTLVKDTRSSHESGNIQAVLDGALQPFIESYLKYRASKK
ncbi:MAG: peptide chain release factor 2 [Planctomycetes bacterium]|nr:peptide chain release factor 2 [Planctomycetota bacterium]